MNTHRLPTDIKYKNYKIHLMPKINTFKFTGHEIIDIIVNNTTNTIKLNTNELDITSASLIINNKHIQSTHIIFDRDREEVSMIFPGGYLNAGTCCQISINFNGTINDKMVGFYRSHYIENGVKKYCASTQFESTDARRAFPCADEPALKATFDIVISVEKDLGLVLSNMPVEVKETDGQFEIYHFKRTPIMSTYLVAFFVGEADYVEQNVIMPNEKNNVIVRVYTPKGKKNTGKFALKLAAETLVLFSNYFTIDYPLPKLDMIGLPDFASGAMENWGLVTYRSKLLYVEETTSKVILEQIASVICHELAHQWFGNLVTMQWWTDLWLNEGFATWVGTMALDKAFPKWNVWESFITDDFNRALDLDRLYNSHPIEVTVNKASEVGEIFDAISYSKGASVIRMLVNILGENIFRKGIINYLNKYKYSNATTYDLWEELSNASGKNVGNMMNNWTKYPGFPLIKIEEVGNNNYVATQRRFGEYDNTMWQFSGDIISNIKNPYTNSVKYTIDDKSTTFSLTSKWFKLNPNCHNLCVTQYPHSILVGLKSAVLSKILSPIDRSELLYNLFMLAEAGYESLTDVLNFVVAYRNEDSLIVIQNMLDKFSSVTIAWNSNKNVLNFINSVQLNLLIYAYKKLGWNEIHGELHSDTVLRRIVISKLGMLGYTPVLNKGQRMFNNFMNNNHSLSADLIKPVLTMCVKHGTIKEYNQVKKLYELSTAEEIKNNCMIAMGCVNKNLVENAMDYIFKSGKIRMQDMYTPIIYLSTGDNTMIVWKYITQNWNMITKMLKGGNFLFSRIICAPIRNVSREDDLSDITSFLSLNKNDVKNVKRSINQELERVCNNINWYNRDNTTLEKFIGKLSTVQAV